MYEKQPNKSFSLYAIQIDSKNPIDSPILSLTCTSNSLYAATKKKVHCIRFPLIAESNQGSKKCQNVSRIDHLVNQNETFIIYQADSNIYIQNESLFAKSGISDQCKIDLGDFKPKFFSTLAHTSKIAFADNQTLLLFSVENGNYLKPTLLGEIRHQVSSPFDLQATQDTVLLFGKKQYCIFSSNKLKILHPGMVNISRPFRCVCPIQGKNDYCAVQDYNLIQLRNERLLLHEPVKFTEDILAIQVKLPYIYAISQKHFSYYLSFASVENNFIPLPSKKGYIQLYVGNKDDYTLYISNDKTIQRLKYSYGPDMKYLKSQCKWEASLEMAKLMNQKLDDIYYSMSEKKFEQKDFDAAFEAFRQSKKSPFDLISRFNLNISQLPSEANTSANEHLKKLEDFEKQMKAKAATDIKIPINGSTNPDLDDIRSEIEETKSVIAELKQLNNMGPKILDPRALDGLQNYIEHLLQKESQPTRIKIYNTVLAAIMVKSQAELRLKDFIRQNRPLFFAVVKNLLCNPESNYKEALYILCEINHQHQDAIQAAKDESTDALIDYISHSSECISLAQSYFSEVFKKSLNEKESKKDQSLSMYLAAKNAARLFFSTPMKECVDEEKKDAFIQQAIDTIDTMEKPCEKAPNDIKNDVLAEFLRFAIFTLKTRNSRFHEKLCYIYIYKLKKLINPENRKNLAYQDISNESDPEVKSTRENLYELLNKSKDYDWMIVKKMFDPDTDPNKRDDPVSQKSLTDVCIEELMAVYLQINQSNSVKSCIELIIKYKVKFDVALDFCHIAYDPNDCDKCQVYQELFDSLKDNYSNCDPSTKNILKKNITTLLNEYGQYLDPSLTIEFIPNDFVLCNLTPFLDKVSTNRINSLRLMKFENALLRSTIERKQQQMHKVASGKVIFTQGLSCIFCGKPLGTDQRYYVLKDSTVAHYFCRNKIHEIDSE